MVLLHCTYFLVLSRNLDRQVLDALIALKSKLPAHMVAKALPFICCLVRTLPRFLTAYLAPWISWFPEGICKVDDTAFLVSVIMASQVLAASLSNAFKLLLIISYLICSLFSVGTSGWCQLLSHSWKEKPALLRTSHFFASFIFPVLSPTILSF